MLVLPLLIMGLAYWLIAARLWRGLRHETGGNSSTTNGSRLQTLMAAESTAPLSDVCGSSCAGEWAEDSLLLINYFTFWPKSVAKQQPNTTALIKDLKLLMRGLQ